MSEHWLGSQSWSHHRNVFLLAEIPRRAKTGIYYEYSLAASRDSQPEVGVLSLRVLPQTQNTADDGEFSQMVGIVVGNQKHFTQVGVARCKR